MWVHWWGGTFLGRSVSGRCQLTHEGGSRAASAPVLLRCRAMKAVISSFTPATRQTRNPVSQGTVNSASNPKSGWVLFVFF